jgi:acetoacetyl-CoA synthetase
MMWNWEVTALATGCSLVLYDGSPLHPHNGVMWDLVDECGVTVFGTSAKWIGECFLPVRLNLKIFRDGHFLF